jgi:hypothetical protein
VSELQGYGAGWNEAIQEMLATAKPMTPEQEREQRISFVYGNVGMSNPDVTRKMVEDAVDGVYAPPHKEPVYAEAYSAPANDNDRGPYIGTYTGRFYMTDPRPEDFTIEDVAHGLANICRYTGACRQRLSVAEHSVHITRWVREQGGSIEEQLCALLHDAPEALSGFGDVARPAKQLAPIIKATEENIWREAVAPKYGLPLELPAIVHEADNRIIADEMTQNMREVDPAYTNPLGITIECWGPRYAESQFTKEFWRLIETGRH